MFQKIREDIQGMVDLGIVITIGIVFAGMTVGAYILWTIYTQLLPSAASSTGWSSTAIAVKMFRNQSKNITTGFDNAIALILVSITIFILALALSALLMLRGRE